MHYCVKADVASALYRFVMARAPTLSLYLTLHNAPLGTNERLHAVTAEAVAAANRYGRWPKQGRWRFPHQRTAGALAFPRAHELNAR